jgi:hypothetical protein
LTVDDDWKEWLRGPNFKPYWQEIWDECLAKQQKSARGPGLEEVLSVMKAYQEDFEDRHVDKSEWKETHYYANFMHQALRRNLKHTDGLFRHRPMGVNEAETLIWATLKLVQHLFAPSQRNRRSGGLALLNADLDHNSHGQEVTNTPRKSKRVKKGSIQNAFPDVASEGQADAALASSDREESVVGDNLATEQLELFNQVMETTLTDSWKSMIRSFGHESLPTKVSDTFDLTDPYWQLMFIRTALKRVEQDCLQENPTPISISPDPDDVSDNGDECNEQNAGTHATESIWHSSTTDDVVEEIDAADTSAGKSATETDDSFFTLDFFQAEEIATDQANFASADCKPPHLMTITTETLQKYQRELRWMDNKELQPDDFKSACDMLYLSTPSKESDGAVRIRHKYMRSNMNLEIWQVLGVARLMQIRAHRRSDGLSFSAGSFLADVMGLGKTIQACCYMLQVSFALNIYSPLEPFSEFSH